MTTSKSTQTEYNNLRALLKEEARAELIAELSGNATEAKPARRGPRKQPKKRAAKAPRPRAAKAKAPREPRARISAEDLARQAAAMLTFIRGNPGKNSEELGAALNLDPAVRSKLVKKLLADGAITMTGKARGARYAAVPTAPAPKAETKSEANGVAKKPKAPRRVTTPEA